MLKACWVPAPGTSLWVNRVPIPRTGYGTPEIEIHFSPNPTVCQLLCVACELTIVCVKDPDD